MRPGRAAALLLACVAPLLMAQAEPILVPEVSQSRIEVRQGFTGANLLLYGAVIAPPGSRDKYDIVVVLKGPTEAVRIREKDRIAGIWMNAGSDRFPLCALVLRGRLLAPGARNRR
ncbi:MAG: hypothetical protein KatS3mg120_1277 [Erythrobacter sp.]|nr:MAG: hypothetical protein KatS3mg120_1277 [Erythrobacter sp.]